MSFSLVAPWLSRFALSDEEYGDQPTYVIVNKSNEYFVGFRTPGGYGLNGEWESSRWFGPQACFSSDYRSAVVFDSLSYAKRTQKRIGPGAAVAGPTDAP